MEHVIGIPVGAETFVGAAAAGAVCSSDSNRGSGSLHTIDVNLMSPRRGAESP